MCLRVHRDVLQLCQDPPDPQLQVARSVRSRSRPGCCGVKHRPTVRKSRATAEADKQASQTTVKFFGRQVGAFFDPSQCDDSCPFKSGEWVLGIVPRRAKTHCLKVSDAVGCKGPSLGGKLRPPRLQPYPRDANETRNASHTVTEIRGIGRQDFEK